MKFAAAKPTGTVTFLFSDIEGSTTHWERGRSAMAAAVARHDLLLRAAIEHHGGYVFKTIGDAFCAAFATAPQAIGAALDAQRALFAQDFSAVDGLRVRMALHTGHADERDDDYFGPPVNRVARLLSIGHGGQIVVSGATSDLLQGDMPAESSLRDLGAYRLKDLARPEQVYQLIVPDLPEAFPPLRSLDVLPNNLPRQLTSFIGRDDVLAEVKTLIETSPLVTLVGTGGAGKTRCAVQAGAELLDRLADGVWFVELAPISDPALVITVIAEALNVRESSHRPLLDIVRSYLKRKHLLLILDNCEHLIAQVRIVSAAIIQDAPQVHVLATSREGLNIRGERVFRMPSLPTDAAVMLFTDRALAANVHFSLTEENAPFVEEICHRLDGIPLALELAAARVKVLSPQQLARKLDERFRLLTGGDRSALPRQQTMRALIDWSYDLLSEDERAVFRKLAIFAGGFTLETAAAVCGDERIDEMALLDLLSSLVDKSLVQADLQGGGTRYRLLESMRQYAHEKLAESGEGYTTAAAHATAFVALAEELDRRYENTPDASWYAQLEPEIDNWRAALEWTLGTEGDVRLGQQLAGALNDVWSVVAPAEGRRWIRTALESVDALTAPTVVAKLNLAEAYADSLLGQHKAADAAAQAALAKYREVGDELGVARAQRSSGRSLVLIGRVEEGEAILHQALLAARTLRAPKLTGLTLEGLAHARAYSEDVPAARAYYQQAIAASNAAGAELQSARTMSNLAECEFRAGDAATAVALAREALLLRRTSNDIRGVANTLCNIAGYLVALHRVDEARAASREALELARDTQAEVLKIFTLQHLGAIAACQSDYVRAGQLLGYVNVRLEGLQAMREYTEQHEYEQVVAVLADVLGKAELQNLINQGGEWSEDHALSEAMLV